MSDNKKFGRGLSGKGYYIALILCAAAIGITSYVFYANEEQDAEVLTEESVYVPVGTMAPEEVDLPVLAPQTEATQPSGTQPEATKPSVITPKEKKVLKTQSPVAGQEVFGYSMETLSYNDTTRDWRVHNGVDIAAEEGTPVCAAAEGTVYTIYEDDTLGHTVVIRHEGGYTTRYSSLAENIPVSAGEEVTVGQTIGYASGSALVETAMGSHVHFSVSCKDIPMDPADFLALGQ